MRGLLGCVASKSNDPSPDFENSAAAVGEVATAGIGPKVEVRRPVSPSGLRSFAKCDIGHILSSILERMLFGGSAVRCRRNKDAVIGVRSPLS